MNIQLKEIAKVWSDIQPIFSVSHNEKDYNKLVNFLDSLIDEVGNNENHPLTSLIETIGSLIETYESQYNLAASHFFWSFAEITDWLSAPVRVDDKDYGTYWIGHGGIEIASTILLTSAG